MDFQNFVDAFVSPTCIVSVEKSADGGYGAIRFVAVNKKYEEIVRYRTNSQFVPDTVYSDIFPQSTAFEDACFRAAVLKKEVHTYAHIYNVDVWYDIYAMPLEYEDGSTCYCSYSAIRKKNADSLVDTLYTSRAANDVLKTCIQLHKANNLKEAMDNVIAEIRVICKAEGCTVLLLNKDEEDFSILATNFVPNSTIKRVTEFDGYYNVANSWKDMLGDEGDCIIVRNEEEMDHIRVINNPWYLTLVEAGVKSVVLFPLRQGNELLGFIWAVNFDTENTMHIKETLELTTFFLSSHIARYKVIRRLKQMSYTDSLTRLPNSFACKEYVADLINKNAGFAAVSIDLNNFKSVNSTFGFDAGNRIIKQVTERWKAIAGNDPNVSGQYLARITGDEFMIVANGYGSQKELEAIITRYLDALGEKFSTDGYDLYVSASFGYAEYPTDADNAKDLITNASTAMHEIKNVNSSEHILRFTPDMIKDGHVLEIEKTIRTALENDTIYFNLQPQFDMYHILRGFESLARMKDSDGSIIPPCEFIPVAEKVGLIDKVDGMVFRKAAEFFGKLIQKTDIKIVLSINASVRHLMKSDFLDEIRDLLGSNNIPADQLEIEITESIMIDSFDKALARIDELKNLGVKIAIDDFGTGYSSLSYLNRFPANLLKIDKSFIDKMNTGESSRQYVASIISIGHVMGFDVISEGVEDPEQLETLKDIGCDYIQGYIWGRPLAPEDAEKLVTGN